VQQQNDTLRPVLKRLALAWVVLLALGAAELAASYWPMARTLRPLVMLPGILMIVIVAFAFMEVEKGTVIVRAFAVAALFWLVILLVLGSADPMTRTNHDVPQAHNGWRGPTARTIRFRLRISQIAARRLI